MIQILSSSIICIGSIVGFRFGVFIYKYSARVPGGRDRFRGAYVVPTHLSIKIILTDAGETDFSLLLCSMKTLEIHSIDLSTSLPLPYAEGGIRAGFPSPAQDYMELAIDLNKEIVKHPASTFYGRVIGDSMRDENIEEGDILVIDKSLDFFDNDLAVCFIDGEFTVKRVKLEDEGAWLIPANPDYPKIRVTADNDFLIWGIVTYTIKKNRRRR